MIELLFLKHNSVYSGGSYNRPFGLSLYSAAPYFAFEVSLRQSLSLSGLDWFYYMGGKDDYWL